MNPATDNAGRPQGAARRAFTLVELVVVMGILAILVTLVVGAIKGIQTTVAAESTRELLSALDGALQRYYQDWGAYPFNVTMPGDPILMKAVAKDILDMGSEPEAVLYVALNLKLRHGPYMPAGVGSTQERRQGAGTYTVYVDGWGRTVVYRGPEKPSDPKGVKVPRLESLGPDEFDKEDNIKNYPYDESIQLVN